MSENCKPSILKGTCVLALALTGCTTTDGIERADDGSISISVERVEHYSDPCDAGMQLAEKFKRTAGSALLGALACTGAALVFDSLKEGESLKAEDYATVAAACAALGALHGYNQANDSLRRQCELHRISQQRKLDMQYELVTLERGIEQPDASSSAASPPETEEVVASVTTISGLGHFASGSAKLTPDAHDYFTNMARQYTEAEQVKSLERVIEDGRSPPEGKQTTEEKARREGAAQADAKRVAELREVWSRLLIVIIGHTDDIGSPASNQVLSEARARNVAEVFRRNGVSAARIYYQGAAASFPIADNRTAVGRAQNRRVEIIELPPGADVSQYLSLRQPNPDLFRPAPAPVVKSDNERTSQPATIWARGTTGHEIDFGGTVAGRQDPQLLDLMGGAKPERHGNWGFVSVAVADEKIYQAPCIRDDPSRYEPLPIKGLADDKPIAAHKTSSFMPGLYNTVWADTVNGHYIAFKNMAVTRNGQAVRPADVLVYEHFAASRDAYADPAVRTGTHVSTMEGLNGLLYRMHMDAGSNLRCVDLVLPYGAPFIAKGGQLYYDYGGLAHEVTVSPSKISQQ